MEVQDLPIPQDFLNRKAQDDAEYQKFQEAKRVIERYQPLKRKLLALREARPTKKTSIKDERAVDHFEFLKKQNETQRDNAEAYRRSVEQKYLENLATLKRNHETVMEQLDRGRQNQQERLAYIEDKLAKARERVASEQKIKTKEEILVEKELFDLIQTFMTLQPGWSLDEAFPQYKDLQLQLPLKSRVTDEVLPPEKPKGKRGPKKVEVEEPPPIEDHTDKETIPPPPAPLPTPPPSQTNPQALPFGNIVSNSKVKRGGQN